jgi:hypothetical protein
MYDLFGILIQYNRKDKVYYIDEEIEDPSSKNDWSISIHQALKEGNKLSLKHLSRKKSYWNPFNKRNTVRNTKSFSFIHSYEVLGHGN